MKPVHLITAISANNGIGFRNRLPWRLKSELNYFSKITSTARKGLNAVVMGRLTWESIPPKYSPMSNRLNVVISTRDAKYPEGVVTFRSVSEAVESLSGPEYPDVETIWIIGGRGVYKEALEKRLCDRLYITHIQKEYECDVFFPQWDASGYQLVVDPEAPSGVKSENGIRYEVKVYQRR